MMRKLLILSLVLFFWVSSSSWAMATTNPLEVSNNKIGIHVLDPGELESASKLINNNGKAEWGYVTVPIQAGDRNLPKWQAFMKKCRELKVIPIVRVLTVPEGANWQQPNNFELVDFANFLNELPWPVKNRYVIIFNEVNHATEFGGFVNPERYALILLNSVKIFKERSSDFFILPAAMDNGTKTDENSLNWRTYLWRMNRAEPDVFKMIDGWNSHAYPNPGMAGRVTDRGEKSIRSYESDLSFLKSLGINRELPIFITETGWDMDRVGGLTAAINIMKAMETVWTDKNIVTVTPFLLQAGEGPFTKFSFLNQDGSPRGIYNEWQRLAVTKGEPVLNEITEKVTLPQIGIPLPASAPRFVAEGFNWQNLWNGLLGWFKVQ